MGAKNHAIVMPDGMLFQTSSLVVQKSSQPTRISASTRSSAPHLVPPGNAVWPSQSVGAFLPINQDLNLISFSDSGWGGSGLATGSYWTRSETQSDWRFRAGCRSVRPADYKHDITVRLTESFQWSCHLPTR